MLKVGDRVRICSTEPPLNTHSPVGWVWTMPNYYGRVAVVERVMSTRLPGVSMVHLNVDLHSYWWDERWLTKLNENQAELFPC